MTLRWLAEADQELTDATAWYDGQAAGLGDRLLDELLLVLTLIERFPHAWHPLTPRIRSQRLNRFPYSVIYAESEGGLVVLAFAHQHRKPFYWHRRIKKAS